MKKKTLPILLTLAGFVALLVTASCGGTSRGDPAEPPAGEARIPEEQVAEAGITVEAVAEREVGGTLVLPGRLAFDDQRVAHVFSPVSGRVVRMVAAPGQRVREGDPLAVLESPDLGSAVSDLAKAKADFEAAERDEKRMKVLFDANAAAARDAEAAEARFRQAKAERDRAQRKARLLAADADGRMTQELVLRSPIDGDVIARAANPGMEVQGQYSVGTAAELFTVGSADRLWALADVYEADLSRVRVGAPVTVRVVAWPDRTFEGRVDWISGALDPLSRTTKVRCVLENPDGALRPEMFASVSMKVPGRRALAVPRTALFRMGDATVVFVKTGRTPDGALSFALRPVRTDDEGSSGPVPVLGGLSPGEEIVTSGTVLVAGKISR